MRSPPVRMIIKDKILIIEDDRNISNLMKTVLRANGYSVLTAGTGEEAKGLITSQCPELIILDLSLPDEDGLNILSYVRSWSNMPIIVVSARSHERDKVGALDMGADDYIAKPFGTSELLARIRTALRHHRTVSMNASDNQAVVLADGKFRIDYDKHRVYVYERDASLTQNEFKIVALLGRFAGRVITYDYIIKEIWGPHMQDDNKILRVNMANIRRKIEKNPAQPEFIFTETGVGYRIVE